MVRKIFKPKNKRPKLLVDRGVRTRFQLDHTIYLPILCSLKTSKPIVDPRTRAPHNWAADIGLICLSHLSPCLSLLNDNFPARFFDDYYDLKIKLQRNYRLLWCYFTFSIKTSKQRSWLTNLNEYSLPYVRLRCQSMIQRREA